VFHFYLAKEHPSKTRIIINNDKITFVTIDAYVGIGPNKYMCSISYGLVVAMMFFA
jgi:hypothetical protein